MNERPITFTLDNGDEISGAVIDNGETVVIRLDRIVVNRLLSAHEMAQAARIAAETGVTVGFTLPIPPKVVA